MSIQEILFFLFCLFVGADKFSVSLGGFTIRFVQLIGILLVFLMLLRKKIKIDKLSIISFLLFLFSHIISFYSSIAPKRTIGYIIFLIFNFITIFLPVYNYVRINPKKSLNIYQRVFSIIGYLVIIQFIFSLIIHNEITHYTAGIPRPGLFFYEPSYLATYLVINFGLTWYEYISNIEYSNKNIKKVLLAFSYVLLTTSLTGILGCILVVGSSIFINIDRKYFYKHILELLILLIITLIIINKFNHNLYFFIFGRLVENGFVGASGSRMSSFPITFDYFINNSNLLFGIGAGAYSKVFGSPPSNVSLEILVNLGILGLITGYLFFLGVIFNKKNKFYEYKKYLFAYLIFFITLQANQSYMRLYHWQLLAIVYSLKNFGSNRNLEDSYTKKYILSEKKEIW